MKIAIELLIILAIFIFVMFWFSLMFVLSKIKLWRYKPENDKGRSAEESRRRQSSNIQRPILYERRVLLPPPAPLKAGRIESLPREASHSIRNPFKRK